MINFLILAGPDKYTARRVFWFNQKFKKQQVVAFVLDNRPQECFMEVENEASSNPVCKGKFSKNVTRGDCCCTGVGAAFGSECKQCPKKDSSKIQLQIFLNILWLFWIYWEKLVSPSSSEQPFSHAKLLLWYCRTYITHIITVLHAFWNKAWEFISFLCVHFPQSNGRPCACP